MKTGKKIISAVLALSMIAAIIPAMPVFAEEEATLIPAERASIDGMPAEGTYFTAGNDQVNVDEHGRYILTIYRDGNISEENTVQIKTVDVSARYGEDYIIDDDRYQTLVSDTDGIIMAHLSDDDYLKASAEAMKEIAEKSDELADAAEKQEDEAAAQAEKEEKTPNEKSPLAIMKEAQTGEKTRETYESEDTDIIPELIGTGFDVANEMETSSETTITFAPNETEKQIIFKILDDNESEGQEMINFVLSNPSDGTMVTEPFTTTVIINDDEPVVHSSVSFTDAEYFAKDGVAHITVKRSEPLYSYVTGVIRTKNGTAESGVNYKATTGMIEFLPYRDETSFDIPVTAAGEDIEFTVELSDLKGGDEGDIMSAVVHISGEDGGHKNTDFQLMDASQNITIKGVQYVADFNENSELGKIYREESPNDIVGYYKVPRDFQYGLTTGNGDHESKFDDKEKAGFLKYASTLITRHGSSYATYNYDQQKYQEIFLDMKTDTKGGSSVRMGFSTNVAGQDKRFTIYGTHDKAIRPETTDNVKLSYKSREGSATQSEEHKPGTGIQTLKVFSERVSDALYNPEMWFYGVVFINREFHINTVYADQLEYKTGSGTQKKIPGAVTANKTKAYTDGTVTFSKREMTGEEGIYGELIGYDIQCGTGTSAQTLKLRPAELGRTNASKKKYGTDCYYAGTDILSRDCSTLTFKDELIKEIDKKTGSVSLAGADFGYYTSLTVKPVFEKIPVKITVVKADGGLGNFTDKNLRRSSTKTFFVGDEIDMAAQSVGTSVNYVGYDYEAFLNPGDTAAYQFSYGTPYTQKQTLTLMHRAYKVKPIFSDMINHVEIRADREVLQYYDIANTVSGNVTSVDSLKGMTLLKTGSNESDVEPIPGKAYTIELTPKQGVKIPEDKRPKITNQYNVDEYADGYRLTFIASAMYQRNVFAISMKKTVGEYKYFTLKGEAMYQSVALLDNSNPLTNEPAKENAVVAGAWLVDALNDNGVSVSKVEFKSAVTDNNGSYKIDGIKAVPGDKVSVLITNNNMDQVEYVTMNEGGEVKSQNFSELTTSKIENGKVVNRYETVTRDCITVDMNTVAMPIRTYYAPYIRKVNLRYAKKPLTNTTNTMEIVEGDNVLASAYVTANKTNVQRVEFLLYDKKGNFKGSNFDVVYDDDKKVDTAKGSEKEKVPEFVYRSGKPDSNGLCTAAIPSGDIVDGDTIYVRIISGEKNSNGNYLTYPLMHVGVTFYTPLKDIPKQRMQVSINGDVGSLPILKDLAGEMDSGGIMWKTTYADPSNTGTSAYVRTIGVAVDVAELKKQHGKNEQGKLFENKWSLPGKSDLDDLRSGTSSPEIKSNAQKVAAMMDNFNPQAENGNMQDELADVYKKKIKEEALRQGIRTDEVPANFKKATAEKLYKEDAYRNNLNEAGKNWKLTFSAKVMMQFMFVYDIEKQEHVFYGAEYVIAGTVRVKKTTYWVIMGVPLFLNFVGTGSLQFDGTYQNYTVEDIKNGALKISAQEVDEMENLLNKRFKNKKDVPWVQIGVSVKIQPGVGYCGVLDVHGTLQLSLVGRFTFTSEQNGKEKPGGFMVDFSGGIGVTLVIVKIEVQLGSILQGWGVFDTHGPRAGGPKLKSVEDDSREQGYTYISPLDVGDGEYEPDTGGFDLQSALRPVGDPTTVVGKTMEKTSPRAVRINDNGDIFMAYLSNNGKGDTANASTLKYKIRRADGSYTEGKEIQPGNEIGDAQPAVLYKDGKVYIAWTSADKKLDNVASAVSKDGTPENVEAVDDENLKTTKDNLKNLNIYLAEYDVENDTITEPVKTVVNDTFENSNVKLVEEKGKVAIYYFKRYIDDISKTNELLSLTSHYNTWAKQVYNPSDGNFESIGKYAEDDAITGHKKGDDITEQLIYFKHPNLSDPLVYDLSAETYTYIDPIDNTAKEYTLYAYTVDTDTNLQTSHDRELWLEITNETDGKTYYPVKLDNGVIEGKSEKSVASPKITAENGDMLITWLYDNSYFKMISVKDTLDALRIESANQGQNAQTAYDDSPLSVFRSLSPEQARQPDWYRTAATSAASKLGDKDGLTKNIAAGRLPITTKDFSNGEANEGLRHEANMSDYNLIVGDDDNVYLFWTEPSEDENRLGRVLYASAYFRVNDEWIKKHGNDETNVAGFSDAAVINDTDLTIDEMSAVVTKDSSAVIFANAYKQKYVKSDDLSKNPIQLDGDRNLVEFAFRPVNSLEVVDDNIELSEQFPVPGDKVDISFTVKNTGILPSEGNTIKLQMLQGDTVIKEAEISKQGDTEGFYVGEEYTYTLEDFDEDKWTIPDSLDDLSVKVIINEDNVEGEDITVNKIQHSAYVEHQEPTVLKYSDLVYKILERTDERMSEKYPEFNIYDLKKEIEYLDENDHDALNELYSTVVEVLTTLLNVINEEYPEFSAFVQYKKDEIQNANSIEDISILDLDDMYDYIVYMPVRNTGNADAAVTAEVNYVNDGFEQTKEIMGRTRGVTVLSHVSENSNEESYIAIPINVTQEQFAQYGVVQGNIKLMNGEEVVDEYTRFTIFETKNVDFTLDSDNNITLKKGETSQIETTAIPYNTVKHMDYYSYNPNIAMVSSDGVITGVGAGTTIITVEDLDSGKAKDIYVTVTDTKKKSSGGGGGGDSSAYKVNIDNKYNSSSSKGTISASQGTANVGDTVTITVTPNDGYEVKDVIVKDKDGNLIEVTKNPDGTYSYVQPESAVTVDAEFAKAGSADNGETTDWWFKDVPETAWYYAPIKEAYDAKRMAGMSEDYFEPETDITRGMFASAVYRMEGSPETDSVNRFEDVAAGSYYETAIAWAAENGIVAGYDDKSYGPDDPITREQLSSILWRYAKYKEKDVGIGEDTNILDYKDAQDISEYAVPAIRWAVGESIITGFEDASLRPKENANRAQMAVILNKISDYFNK